MTRGMVCAAAVVLAINASATCSGAPASLGVLRLRGGAAKAPRSAPSKKRGSAASGAGQPRRSAEGQGATEALDTGSAAPQHIYRADKRRGEDKRLAKTGKSFGSGADGKAASQAPVARAQDEAESATKASLTSSVVPKRPASQVVTGEYFRKKLRAADRAAHREATRNMPLGTGTNQTRHDDFNPGAADSLDQNTPFEKTAAPGAEANETRTPFIPVLYDGVIHRPPVRERDEWLELFRSMDTYKNVIDLKLVEGILDRAGVPLIDKRTLKFAGFLVDAYIARVCDHAADWARLRLEGEEEMKESAAKAANRLAFFQRDDVVKRIRRNNFTLVETDVLRALNEMNPGSDLPFLRVPFTPAGKGPNSASSHDSDYASEEESSELVSSNAMDQDGELLRRKTAEFEGGGDEDGGEQSAESERGNYLDPAAALEMARFGLSRKQSAALETALQKEKDEEEASKNVAKAGMGVRGPAIDRLVDSDQESEDDEDEDGADPSEKARQAEAARRKAAVAGGGAQVGRDRPEDEGSDDLVGKDSKSDNTDDTSLDIIDEALEQEFSQISLSTSQSESEDDGYFVVSPTRASAETSGLGRDVDFARSRPDLTAEAGGVGGGVTSTAHSHAQQYNAYYQRQQQAEQPYNAPYMQPRNPMGRPPGSSGAPPHHANVPAASYQPRYASTYATYNPTPYARQAPGAGTSVGAGAHSGPYSAYSGYAPGSAGHGFGGGTAGSREMAPYPAGTRPAMYPTMQYAHAPPLAAATAAVSGSTGLLGSGLQARAPMAAPSAAGQPAPASDGDRAMNANQSGRPPPGAGATAGGRVSGGGTWAGGGAGAPPQM